MLFEKESANQALNPNKNSKAKVVNRISSFDYEKEVHI